MHFSIEPKRLMLRELSASEAARACMDLAFSSLRLGRIAEKNGMRLLRYFDKTINGERVREALYEKALAEP